MRIDEIAKSRTRLLTAKTTTLDLAKPNKTGQEKYLGEVEMLADMLSNRCSDFVEAYKKTNWEHVLYRGVKSLSVGATPIFVQHSIRQDRRPLVMEKEPHDLLIKVFNELGLKANRENSIFVTPMSGIAGDWGAAMAVFVEDGWSGTVFKNAGHTYAFDRLYGLALNKLNNRITFDELVAAVDNLRPLQFKADSLVQELNADPFEMLITGKTWFGVLPKVLPELKKFL